MMAYSNSENIMDYNDLSKTYNICKISYKCFSNVYIRLIEIKILNANNDIFNFRSHT